MAKDSWYHPPSPSPKDKFQPNTFGSARYLKKEEATALGLTQEGKGQTFCPYMGAFRSQNGEKLVEIFARSPSHKFRPTKEELHPGTGNIITFGTTRSGKGTGQIIINLLAWEGSVLVLDVKGENYFHSAGCRAKKMNQAVFRFAPFENESHIWNPIMAIKAVENFDQATWQERCQEEEDTRYLANLIITPSGSNNDAFWEDKARALLVGLLLHVRTAKLIMKAKDITDEDKQHLVRERSMREVTRLIALETDSFTSLLIDMSESPRRLVSQVGHSFQGYLKGEGKLGQSIKSMLLKHTDVWVYERVHRVTYKASEHPGDNEPGANDFDFSQMRERKTSFYLIIPPEYLSEYRSVLRVMMGCAIRELKGSYSQLKRNPDYATIPPVLFLLDEFPQLGQMTPIEEGLAYLAGYGIRFWFFLQDINQLKAHYPNTWESFLANTEFKCFFGVNDIHTAKLVSEMAGNTTVDTNSNTTLPSNPNGQYRSPSITQAYTSRPLITPDEVLNMHPNKQIVFFKSLNPIYLDLPKYYEFPELQAKSDLPPPQEINFCV